MKIRTCLLSLGILGCALAGNATDLPDVVFKLRDNTQITIPSENMEINYENGILHITTLQIKKDISSSDLLSMSFSSVTTDVISNVAPEESDIDIYTATGLYLGHFRSLEEIYDDIESGLYIVKSGNKTYKIAR